MVVLSFYSFVLYLSTEITTHKSRFLKHLELKEKITYDFAGVGVGWGGGVGKAVFPKSSPCSISFFQSQRFWEEVILENIFPQFETLSSAETQHTGISNMLVKTGALSVSPQSAETKTQLLFAKVWY